MHHIINAAISTVHHYKRICPKCKRAQVTPPDKKSKTVKCKFCGADIPSAQK